ncbi:MAG TPA: MlrC C-terminal domain-containing protein, partial [Acidobacteriota bacterium]|nr:MlrC C-terminal domain-containing protein [Acidobacteriota bacterium]
KASPVVLMDTGDNIGGGSAGDSTFLLEEFLRQKTEGWVMSIVDREAVEKAAKTGVGSRFDALIGAKTDDLHGRPVRVTGYVRSLRRSQYDNADLTAVIEVDGSTRDLQNLLILTSRASGARSVQELTSNGIDPSRQTVIVSKGVVAPFATFRDVAGEIIMANTPGPTDVNPRHFQFKNVRRPFHGLD